jgi:serine/threonine protein kinase
VLLSQGYNIEEFEGYPVPKMGDFGLAQLTSLTHAPNSRKYKQFGTMVWAPPEQFDLGHLDYRWRNPLIHPNHNRNLAFDQRHGVWQIAALCFSLLRLEVYNDELFKVLTKLQNDRDGEHKMGASGGFLLNGKLRSAMHNNYSNKLVDTLNQCLNIHPEQRPYPDDLVRICQEGMAAEVERLDRDNMAIAPVFYGRDGRYKMKDHVKRLGAQKNQRPQQQRRRGYGGVRRRSGTRQVFKEIDLPRGKLFGFIKYMLT